MACVQPLEDHQHPPHPSTTLVHKQPHPPLSPTPLASTQAVDDTDGQLRSFNTPLYSSGLHPVLGSQGTSKLQSHRQRIVEEIYDTEHSYISQLTTIISLFLKPIRVGGLLSPHTIKAIFSNIEEILSVNQELFASMRRRSLGDAFSHLGPFLKLYSTYAENYQRANETLQISLKEDSDFCSFVMSQEVRPECCGLQLCSLLIVPVQRVPRYKLLLDDLVKHTKKSHTDYEKLKAASAEIAAVMSHINEHVRKHENMLKMVAIQQSLTGPKIPTIVTPGRSFIHEGKLMKLSNSNKLKSPMERMVFLFSDILVYAKPIGTKDAQMKYECRCILPLIQSAVKLLNVDERAPGISKLFEISNGDISLVFYSLDPSQVTVWAKKICNARRLLQDDEDMPSHNADHSIDTEDKRKILRLDLNSPSKDATPQDSVTTQTTLFSPLLDNQHTNQEPFPSCTQQTKEQTSGNDESQVGPTNEGIAGTDIESSGIQSDSKDTHRVPESSQEMETVTESRAENRELNESRDTDRLIERSKTPSLSSLSTMYSLSNQTGRVASACCTLL